MSHPSSVSLIMSHISIFKVQSSLCSEPSVALSGKEKNKKKPGKIIDYCLSLIRESEITSALMTLH